MLQLFNKFVLLGSDKLPERCVQVSQVLISCYRELEKGQVPGQFGRYSKNLVFHLVVIFHYARVNDRHPAKDILC